MGLSSITPRTFNSTGAQSVCRANKPEPDEVIESDFLTKCTMKYIHGTGPTTVRGSLKALPNTTLPSNKLNQDVFYLESDIDAISGVDLSISIEPADVAKCPKFDVNGDGDYELSDTTDSGGHTVLPKDFLLSIINKVEVNIGGHLHQTILPEEIFMRNLTEQCTTNLDDWLNNGVDNQFKNNYQGPYSTMTLDNGDKVTHVAYTALANRKTNNLMLIRDGTRYTFTLSLPITGRTTEMKHSFLQAGAITNSFKIIVYYNQIYPDTSSNKQWLFNGTPSLSSLGSHAVLFDSTTEKAWLDTYKSWLTVKDHIFTETESEFLKSNIVNRVVNTSQSVVREIQKGETIEWNSDDYPMSINGMFNYSSDSTSAFNNSYINLQYIDAAPNSLSANGSIPIRADKGTLPITIDLKSIDLNASHLLISAFASTHQSDGSISISPIESALSSASDEWQGSPIILNEPLTPLSHDDLVLIYSDAFAFTGYSHGDASLLSRSDASSMRGILSGWLDSVEVKLGSDTTGRIPANALIKTGQDFGLTSAGDAPVYVIPLADKPFSTAGVPMNRVGKAQVVLHVDRRYAMQYGPFTQVEGSYNNPSNGTNTGTPDTTTNKIKPWAPITKVAVVAVGTKVQSTVGGSTTFA